MNQAPFGQSARISQWFCLCEWVPQSCSEYQISHLTTFAFRILQDAQQEVQLSFCITSLSEVKYFYWYVFFLSCSFNHMEKYALIKFTCVLNSFSTKFGSRQECFGCGITSAAECFLSFSPLPTNQLFIWEFCRNN